MGAVAAVPRVWPPTCLEHVAMEATPFPADLLEGCETGLCLFAAAFYGRNDAIWFAEAGIETTCVDRDGAQLVRMERLYPDRWPFIVSDAWEFAEAGRQMGARYDAISVDTFTGDAERRALDSLDLWCELANRLVTVTITLKNTGTYRTPEGWRSSLSLRSERRAGDIFWLVLERA